MRQYQLKYSELSTEARRRANARAYANVYLKLGKITRWPCAACGNPKAQMHHEDYSKPLAVLWLCRPCHLAHHRGWEPARAAGAGGRHA